MSGVQQGVFGAQTPGAAPRRVPLRSELDGGKGAGGQAGRRGRAHPGRRVGEDQARQDGGPIR